MTPADLNFATTSIRALQMLLGGLRVWVGNQILSPADDAFLRAIDLAGEAAKTWLRAKVTQAGEDASE